MEQEQHKPIQYPLLTTQVHPAHPQYPHYQDNAQGGQQFPNPISYGVDGHDTDPSIVAVQQPQNPALVSKCQELEDKIKNNEIIFAIHYVYHALMMIPYGLLALFIAYVLIFNNRCFGHNWCFIGVAGFLAVVVLNFIPIAFIMTHKYAFCVFYFKQGEKMNMVLGLYVVSIIIYTGLSGLFYYSYVVPYLVVYVGILVFLTVTAVTLERLCRELRLIKSQLSGDTQRASVAY